MASSPVANSLYFPLTPTKPGLHSLHALSTTVFHIPTGAVSYALNTAFKVFSKLQSLPPSQLLYINILFSGDNFYSSYFFFIAKIKQHDQKQLVEGRFFFLGGAGGGREEAFGSRGRVHNCGEGMAPGGQRRKLVERTCVHTRTGPECKLKVG